MRFEELLSPEEVAELQAIRTELTGDKEAVTPAKSERQIKHERSEALMSKASEKAKLKAFWHVLDPMIRGFVTKVKNTAHDKDQTRNLGDKDFVQQIFDKIRTSLMNGSYVQ
jgi:hypothetical protein